MKIYIALVFALLLSACGTSPEPDYYGMSDVDGSPLPVKALAIKVQRPSLPDYLDRPGIVRGESRYQYTIDDMHRWAAPLDRMFERILTVDLRQRLPDCRVMSESDTGTSDLRLIVDTNIEKFNIRGSDVFLAGQMSITDRVEKRTLVTRRFDLQAPAGSSADAIAAASSLLIGRYADLIATSVRPSAQ